MSLFAHVPPRNSSKVTPTCVGQSEEQFENFKKITGGLIPAVMLLKARIQPGTIRASRNRVRVRAAGKAAIDASKATIETEATIEAAHGHAAAGKAAIDASKATIETEAAIEAAHGHAPAAKAAKMAPAAETATHMATAETATHVAATETATHMAATETTAHVAATETTAHMAATECQGGTARQRRAKRGRGQQYTEASHRSLLTGYESKDSRGRNNGLVEIVS